MTLPWDQASAPTYDTIALAEAAITAAGYVRDTNRHIWVNGNRTAKVVRQGAQFAVQWN